MTDPNQVAVQLEAADLIKLAHLAVVLDRHGSALQISRLRTTVAQRVGMGSGYLLADPADLRELGRDEPFRLIHPGQRPARPYGNGITEPVLPIDPAALQRASELAEAFAADHSSQEMYAAEQRDDPVARAAVERFVSAIRLLVLDYQHHRPTQWAYDRACEALRKHRSRADAAEADRDEARWTACYYRNAWRAHDELAEWSLGLLPDWLTDASATGAATAVITWTGPDGTVYDLDRDLVDRHGGRWRFARAHIGDGGPMLAEVCADGTLAGCCYQITTVINSHGPLTQADPERRIMTPDEVRDITIKIAHAAVEEAVASMTEAEFCAWMRDLGIRVPEGEYRELWKKAAPLLAKPHIVVTFPALYEGVGDPEAEPEPDVRGPLFFPDSIPSAIPGLDTARGDQVRP